MSQKKRRDVIGERARKSFWGKDEGRGGRSRGSCCRFRGKKEKHLRGGRE